MAYDDSRFRGEPGFRDEPEFRGGSGVPEDAPPVKSIYAPGAFPVAERRGADYDQYGDDYPESTINMAASRRGGPSAAQLDAVFDDPDYGDPGRDRMAVHAIWEVVLLLGAGALTFLLRDSDAAALRGGQLKDLFLLGAELGLISVGMALSLRANSVNLAAGPIAYAAALYFADNAEGTTAGLLSTAGITIGIAAAAGAAIAVLVAGFHVPSWAASLAGGLLLVVWIDQQRAQRVPGNLYDPHDHALYWFVGVVALSVIGGLLGLARSIRRGVARFRPVSDPAQRRGTGGGLMSAVALVGSSALAGGAGVLLALDERSVAPNQSALTLLALALGAALLGGTSAFGRRGGVLGTALAVIVLVLFSRYSAAKGWDIALLAIGAFAIVAGLIVTRLVETFGRPRPLQPIDEEPEEPQWARSAPPPADMNDSGSWSGARTGWTSQLPARTTDEGWGAEERWGTR
jgi:ribose/xylose/arabinose/galactoside ABC-type transport system permease subunit